MKKCLFLRGTPLAAVAVLGLAVLPARAQTWAPITGVNEVLGTTGLAWLTTAEAPWTVDAETFGDDGKTALRSGEITGDKMSGLKTSVTGPGIIKFNWIAFDYHFYQFKVTGQNQKTYRPWFSLQPLAHRQ